MTQEKDKRTNNRLCMLVALIDIFVIHRVHKTMKIKQRQNTICVGHHYAQTSINHVNKTCIILQTTGGKDEPNIVFMGG
jgi:hypothetical protein